MEVWQESVRQFVDPSTSINFIVDDVDLAKAVNILCEEEQIDLVVMSITGKTNLEKIFIDSNTIRVMETIRYPLLVVPQKTMDMVPEKVALATDLNNVRQKTAVPTLFKFLDVLNAKLLVINIAHT